MRILLVRPPRIKQAVTLGEMMFCEPLGLECLYKVLKEDHRVEILDLMVTGENFSRTLKEFKPDIVGITSLCIDVNNVVKLAKEAKEIKPEVITFVGGTQAYLNPEGFFTNHIDHVFKYTTTDNLKKFMHIISKGVIEPIDGIHSRALDFMGTNVHGRNEYMVPDRIATKKYRSKYSYLGYKPCAIMQTSLGCSKNCDFCLRWRIEGAKEKDIQLDLIIKQLKEIEEPSVMICDNDFLNDEERLEKFCDLLEQEGIVKNFICYGSVHSVLSHPHTISRLKDNGLKAVLVGYETFNNEEMKNYKKKSTVEDNIKASKILKQIGIDVWASFMLHPDWSLKDFKSMKSYVRKLKPEISTFSPLTPFPNLPMYKEYKERVIYNQTEYEAWSFGKVTIIPSKMSLRRYYFELLRFVLYINIRMNSTSYMIKRFGAGTVLRMAKGSFGVVKTYLKLMITS